MMARRWLLEPLAMLVEVIWYFAVTSVLVAALSDGSSPSLWLLIAAAGGGFYISRLLGLFELSPRALATVGATTSIVGLYAILRLEYLGDLSLWELSWLGEFAAHPGDAQGPLVLGSLLTVILALRWLQQGQGTITFDSVVLTFSVGFTTLVGAAVIDVAADLDSALDTAALPFFALGLIAIAAYHLERATPDTSATMSRPWALTLFSTVGLLIALAVLATVMLLATMVALSWLANSVNAGSTLAAAGQGLQWLWDRLADLLILAITPIAMAIEWSMRGIRDLLGANFELETPEPGQPATEGEETESGRLPLPLALIARVAGGVLLVALVVVLALAIFARVRRRLDERPEWRESLWHEGSPKDDLGNLLGRLFSSRRRRSPSAPDLPSDVLAVRRLYLGVLSRAAKRGLERPPARTPLEFASPLAEHLRSPAASEISLAFARARYGLKGLSPEEIHRLRKAWDETGK